MERKEELQAVSGCAPGLDLEILKVWQTPGPADDPDEVRPKEFRVVRFPDGELALCKSDSAPDFIVHEAEILECLHGVSCVPGLVGWTPTRLYTSYVEGELLPDAIRGLGLRACLKVGWQILAAVASVHARGVVHSDVRPWNFIYGRDARLYLIDFEYAYLRSKPEPESLLRVHHVSGLKTRFSDWVDTCRCIADVWQASPHRLVRCGLSCVPLGAHWAMRLAGVSCHVVSAFRRVLPRARTETSLPEDRRRGSDEGPAVSSGPRR